MSVHFERATNFICRYIVNVATNYATLLCMSAVATHFDGVEF